MKPDKYANRLVLYCSELCTIPHVFDLKHDNNTMNGERGSVWREIRLATAAVNTALELTQVTKWRARCLLLEFAQYKADSTAITWIKHV